ncbi:NAD+ diphosphatase [Trueperella bonasi]|uniref:NAD(+) diphosphatase n=1 Tax=Trueperella bonasi TaxID=312286 RepID=A0ABT9NHA0_9ACTO|nr:NAD(+) diphosphatase [Trueperella bonasi]MDP9806780.1 NAD+ diphosphatase [Trueperella bonasi]
MYGKLSHSREIADRDAATRLNPGSALADPNGRYVLVQGDAVAACGDALVLWDRDRVGALGEVAVSYLGRYRGAPYFGVDVGPASIDATWQPELAEVTFEGFYGLGPLLSEVEANLAMSAIALANWQRRSKFCPRCGSATELVAAGWEQRCQGGHMVYPRLDPAVIMAIHDSRGRILLGRNRAWPEGRFSTLAGFVEAGETIEDAVRREVREEVQIDVGRLEYFGSQPWPFPRSLMLGFHGYVYDDAQEIKVDGVEVVDARWFTRDEVKALYADNPERFPGRTSVARALIEDWYGGVLSEG